MFRPLRFLVAALLGLSLALPSLASDYRAIDVPAAILYDAPSQKAKKLFLIRAGTPVEAVVRLEGWAKVRDAEGTLAWVESTQLNDQRSLIVIASDSVLRALASETSEELARFDKWVVLEYLAPASAGWVQVRHRDGMQGYVRATQVWGL